MAQNLYQKINTVMSDVTTVFKGVEVKGYGGGGRGYRGVSHDDVTALLHGPLTKVGIVAKASMDSHDLIEGVTSKGGKVYISQVWASVEFINADNPDERMTSRAFAMGFDSQDKGAGKAYSMAVKYCFLKTFMLESSDDEEQRLPDEVKIKNNLMGNLSAAINKAKKEDADSLREFMESKGLTPDSLKELTKDGIEALLIDINKHF